MKVSFDVRYGRNVIDIPLYPEPKTQGGGNLSDLKDKTFTIINRIPTSANNPQISKWIKSVLMKCDMQDGIFDKTSQTMVYKAHTWTAWVADWQRYKAPHWLDDGYYALADDEKSEFYTVNAGDLLIFSEIPDSAPTSEQEFQQLAAKYKNTGGILTASEAYINYRPNGTPWRTNHIEIIRG